MPYSDLMRSLFIFFFVFITTHPALAASDFGEVQILNGATSDDLTVKIYQFQLNKNKKNFAWPYSHQDDSLEWGLLGRYTESRAPNLTFQLSDLVLGGGFILSSNHFIRTQFGASYLQEDSRDFQTTLLADVEYTYKWGQNSVSGLTVGQGHMTPMVIALNGPAQSMYSQNLGLFTDWNFLTDWQFSFKTRGDISQDSNQRFWMDSQVMYAISKFPHWIRVGFGTTYLGYQFPTGQYWSPRRFSAYGPRADVSVSVVEEISLFFGGSYNLFQEDSFSPGDGYYVRTGMNWGDRNSHLLSLSFENGESTQNNRLWYSHFYNLSLSVFW